MKIKSATYIKDYPNLTLADRLIVAKHDLVCTYYGRPEYLRDIRQNAGTHVVRGLNVCQPQYAPPWDGVTNPPPPWWDDRSWSPIRAMQEMAWRNNWYLRNARGVIIQDSAGDCILNWTRYCPVGVYGDARGLRAAEWYAMKLAQICGAYAWNATDTWNGIMFEVFADRLSVYTPEIKDVADPQRTGRAVSDDELANLMNAENGVWWYRFQLFRPPALHFWFNDNKQEWGPEFLSAGQSFKSENFEKGSRRGTWESWTFEDFPSIHRAQEIYAGSGAIDGTPVGTAASILYHWRDPQWSVAEAKRQAIRAQATGLLFGKRAPFLCISGDEIHPEWYPEFETDLGEPAGELPHKEKQGTGYLYSMEYSKARVLVNRTGAPISGPGVDLPNDCGAILPR